MSIHFLTRNVGQGFKEHVLDGDSLKCELKDFTFGERKELKEGGRNRKV